MGCRRRCQLPGHGQGKTPPDFLLQDRHERVERIDQSLVAGPGAAEPGDPVQGRLGAARDGIGARRSGRQDGRLDRTTGWPV